MAVSEDRSVVITGASQGIGREMALQVASTTKHPILLIARNEANLRETQSLCKKAGAKIVEYVVCDLSDDDHVQALSKNPLIQTCGVLVNNAGYYLQEAVRESNLKAYQSQMEANFYSAVRMTSLLLPILTKASEARLMFTCSVTAQKGQARCAAYSASKNALNGYIQSLRESLLDSKVAVTSIILGQTFSPSWGGSGIDPKRLIDPKDVGKAVVFLIGLSKQTCVEEMVIRPQKGDL